jgi:DNA-binding GntR family transcriptional regulator
MTDDRTPPGQPLYRQIADHYAAAIESGDLRPGDPIPTVRAMAESWGVSSTTIKRTLLVLQASGLVRSTRGSGTIVARSSPAASGHIASFAAVARQDGTQMETVNTFVFANFVTAPPYVADALGLDPGHEVIKRVRERRTPGGEPVLMAESWCDGACGHAVPRLLVLEDVPGGLATIEAGTGMTMVSLVERVSAALATPEQADFYGLVRPAAVIIKDHTWYAVPDGEPDAEPTPFYFGRGWHRGDEWSTYSVPL